MSSTWTMVPASPEILAECEKWRPKIRPALQGIEDMIRAEDERCMDSLVRGFLMAWGDPPEHIPEWVREWFSRDHKIPEIPTYSTMAPLPKIPLPDYGPDTSLQEALERDWCLKDPK